MIDTDDLALRLAELSEKEDSRTALPRPYFQRPRGFGLDVGEQGLPFVDVERKAILGRCEDELSLRCDRLSSHMSVRVQIDLKRVDELTIVSKGVELVRERGGPWFAT